MDDTNGLITQKVTDLTESLYRTTDVLSSADRMIDHYRDLNREQEHEIARLKGSLHKADRKTTKDGGYHSRSHSSLHLQDHGEDSLSSNDERRSRRNYHSSRSKVHFTDEIPVKKDVNRRQNLLDEELLNKGRLRERDRERFDEGLFRNEACSTKEEYCKQSALDGRIVALQEKLENDHNNWKSQQMEMQNLTKEMITLKEVVQEVATPNKKKIKKLFKVIDESSDLSDYDSDVEKELDRYKKRVSKDKEIIGLLEERLRRTEKENISFQSTVNEIQNIGEMKNNQVKLLEKQLDKEKSERTQLERTFHELRYKTEDMEKDRVEILERFAHIKAESKIQKAALERSSQTVPELKILLERSEQQRDKLSEHIFKLKGTNQAKSDQITKLENEKGELARQISSFEKEHAGLSKQSENDHRTNSALRDELDNAKKKLAESELYLKQLEKGKQELKEKALQTLKEYRLKCRKYEQRIDETNERIKMRDAELAREFSRSKEFEIENLKLQKEYQDLSYELDSLRNDFNGRDKRMTQLLDDRNHIEQILQEASQTNKLNSELKKDVHRLKSEKLDLNSQLAEEKCKAKEFETLLHEKQMTVQEQISSLHNQLQEEHNAKALLTARLQEEQESSVRRDFQKMKDRNHSLEKEKKELADKVTKLEQLQRNLSKNIDDIEKDKSDSENKEKVLLQKLKKSAEDVFKLRKQAQAMKNTYEEKLREMERCAAKSNDQNGILQNQVNEYQTEVNMLKDVIKMTVSITTRDLENLLNLLCREEENMLPVKEIPDSMSPEHQKVMHEMREKIQACYSISKTMKQKFHQQKSFVKKVQERLKKHAKEHETFKEEMTSENEKLTNRVRQLEPFQTSHSEQKQRILRLQCQVEELSKHLEECTNALQKSLEFENDRNKVLKEIDELRSEHKERMKMEETYYRNTEKAEILNDQLQEAKKSLEQIKQETEDSALFTTRVLDSFSAVSPSCRKRSMHNQTSPKLKLSRTLSSYVSTYNDELETTPTKEVTQTRRASPTKSRQEVSFNEVDPMSMTDDEFDKFFLPKKASSGCSTPSAHQ